jgi:hypothetical protein
LVVLIRRPAIDVPAPPAPAVDGPADEDLDATDEDVPDVDDERPPAVEPDVEREPDGVPVGATD